MWSAWNTASTQWGAQMLNSVPPPCLHDSSQPVVIFLIAPLTLSGQLSHTNQELLSSQFDQRIAESSAYPQTDLSLVCKVSTYVVPLSHSHPCTSPTHLQAIVCPNSFSLHSSQVICNTSSRSRPLPHLDKTAWISAQWTILWSQIQTTLCRLLESE